MTPSTSTRPAATRAAGGTRRPYAARVPAGERRTQLLDAALRVIVRDGYDAVSVDAIAREAGVTRPVVYGVFDGLGPLLSALLDRQQERALSQLAAALPANDGPADPDVALLQSARQMVEQVRSDPLTWQPILLAPIGTPEAVRTRIEADRRALVTQLAGLLELGLALRGGPDLDPEVYAHAILAVLEHFGRLLLAEPELFETDRLIAAVAALLRALR